MTQKDKDIQTLGMLDLLIAVTKTLIKNHREEISHKENLLMLLKTKSNYEMLLKTKSNYEML